MSLQETLNQECVVAAGFQLARAERARKEWTAEVFKESGELPPPQQLPWRLLNLEIAILNTIFATKGLDQGDPK